MRIGVIGYFGHGNLGDERIFDTYRFHMNEWQVIPIHCGFAFTEDWLAWLNTFDYLILGGGGLFIQGVLPPFDTFHLWGDRLSTPISVIGLGVDKVPSLHRDALQALVQQTHMFVVRDLQSAELINSPKVEVYPDMTFAYPLHRSLRSKPDQIPVCGINLRACLRENLPAWQRALQEIEIKRVGLPFWKNVDVNDADVVLSLDENCEERDVINAYQQIDFLVGTAFHSIVFAVQAGIPFVAIGYASKVKRFVSDLGLENCILDVNQANIFLQRYRYCMDNWDEIRSRLLDEDDLARHKALEMMARLKMDIAAMQPMEQQTKSNVRAIVIRDPGDDIFCSQQFCQSEGFEVEFVQQELSAEDVNCEQNEFVVLMHSCEAFVPGGIRYLIKQDWGDANIAVCDGWTQYENKIVGDISAERYSPYIIRSPKTRSGNVHKHFQVQLFYRPESKSVIQLETALRYYFEGQIERAQQALSGLEEKIFNFEEIVMRHCVAMTTSPEQLETILKRMFYELFRKTRYIFLKKKLIAKVWMKEFFDAYQTKQVENIWRSFWRGMINDPSWLLNLGVWSILFQAFLRRWK